MTRTLERTTRLVFESDPAVKGRTVVTISAATDEEVQAEIYRLMEIVESECGAANFCGPTRFRENYVGFGEIFIFGGELANLADCQ